jgi:hypothetical protein
LTYEGLIGDNTASVTIQCNNWKNPVLPEIVTGFVIKTYDASNYEIDESEDFSYDGTILSEVSIDMSQITFSTFTQLSGGLYGIIVDFETSLDV